MKPEPHVLEVAQIPPLQTIDVDVIATPDGKGGVNWSHDIKTNGHDKGGKIDAKAGIGYKIEFNLIKPHDLDVRFDASDPIFAREGGGTFCPTKLDTKQLMIDSCKDDELVVIDWNYGSPGELHYQLNFVTSAGDPVNPYDPIIDNGGGGVKPFLSL